MESTVPNSKPGLSPHRPSRPADEMQARFLQKILKSSITNGLRNSIMLDIQEALNQNHKYVKELKCLQALAK